MTKALPKFTATLEMGEETYKGEGKDAYEALSSFPLSYIDIKLKGTITLFKGKKSASRFLYKRPLKKVIVNNLIRAGLARNLVYLLDEPQEGIEEVPFKAVKEDE